MEGRDGMRACSTLQWPTSGCSTRETEMNGREGCCAGGRGDLQSPKMPGTLEHWIGRAKLRPPGSPTGKGIASIKGETRQQPKPNGYRLWEGKLSVVFNVSWSTWVPFILLSFSTEFKSVLRFQTLCTSHPPCDRLHIDSIFIDQAVSNPATY
jgi:hypothetical protein